jgi:hypothetical protein
MPQIDPQQAIDFMTPALRNPKVKLFVLNSFRVGELRGARDLSAFVELVDDLGVKAKVIRRTADEEYHVRYLTELIKQFQDEGFAEDVRTQQAIVDRINEETGAAMDARMAEQFARLMAEA